MRVPDSLFVLCILLSAWVFIRPRWILLYQKVWTRQWSPRRSEDLYLWAIVSFQVPISLPWVLWVHKLKIGDHGHESSTFSCFGVLLVRCYFATKSAPTDVSPSNFSMLYLSARLCARVPISPCWLLWVRKLKIGNHGHESSTLWSFGVLLVPGNFPTNNDAKELRFWNFRIIYLTATLCLQMHISPSWFLWYQNWGHVINTTRVPDSLFGVSVVLRSWVFIRPLRIF